jgi:quercetin dioxygenase-like cupin family protein
MMRSIDSNPVKGPSYVIAPDSSRSYWMPEPAKGFCSVIISPSDFPMVQYEMGVQQFEPGEELPEHHHDLHDELMYIMEGSGLATLDGIEHRLEKGATLFVGRNVVHGFLNDGAKPLVWLWIMNPPGLAHVLHAVGAPRRPGEPRPEQVLRPTEPNPLVRHISKRS